MEISLLQELTGSLSLHARTISAASFIFDSNRDRVQFDPLDPAGRQHTKTPGNGAEVGRPTGDMPWACHIPHIFLVLPPECRRKRAQCRTAWIPCIPRIPREHGSSVRPMAWGWWRTRNCLPLPLLPSRPAGVTASSKNAEPRRVQSPDKCWPTFLFSASSLSPNKSLGP